MRVNELASEVAVATAALGQAAKELTDFVCGRGRDNALYEAEVAYSS